MRIRIALGLLVLLVAPGIRAQQGPCGDGIPCKPVVWELPQFPELISPTPVNPPGDFNNPPTSPPVPTATWTPLFTSTAIPTFTPFFDSGEIQDSVATVQALLAGTQQPVLNASGTPITIETEIGQIGGNADVFIGYVRTLQGSDVVGPFGPLLTMFFAGIGIVILLQIGSYLLVIVPVLLGIIRKIVSILAEFLPF